MVDNIDIGTIFEEYLDQVRITTSDKGPSKRATAILEAELMR